MPLDATPGRGDCKGEDHAEREVEMVVDVTLEDEPVGKELLIMPAIADVLPAELVVLEEPPSKEARTAALTPALGEVP